MVCVCVCVWLAGVSSVVLCVRACVRRACVRAWVAVMWCRRECVAWSVCERLVGAAWERGMIV